MNVMWVQWMTQKVKRLCKRAERLTVWAEEASALSSGQHEWSFANGATGRIGLPLWEDWELVALTLHVLNFPVGREVVIEVIDRTTGIAIPGAQITATSGTTRVAMPNIPIPEDTILGFRTVSVTGGGGVSNARVVAWLKRYT